MSKADSTVKIEHISSEYDIRQAFGVMVECFGHQTSDGVFYAMNPGWDTPEGFAGGVQRTVDRWKAVKKNAQGQPNEIFLKAVAPRVNSDAVDIVVGFAIWQQLSMLEGYGDRPEDMDVKAIYPEDETERRYLAQVEHSLYKRRAEVVAEKAVESLPALFVLDLCVVHPGYQRRGIANKLVQWGLDEAKRRGDLECATEASAMGRGAYTKLGFRAEGADVVYNVDEEFRDRKLPSNLFMRTGIKS